MFPSGDSLPPSLREVLQREGFSSQLVTSLDELGEILKEKHKPILVAACGEDEAEALKITKGIIQRKVLHEHPLLITGKSVDGFDNIVSRYFKHHLSIPSPVNTQDLMAGIRYLISNYPDRDSQALNAGEGREEKAETEVLTQPALADLSVPTLVFSQLSSLPKEQIGGAQLKQKLGLDHLKLLGLVPEKEVLQNAVGAVFEKVNHWSKEHLCRTTFIADKFNKALGLPEEAMQRTHASALLIPSSFSKHSLSLLRKNYLRTSDTTRQKIARKIEESAQQISKDFKEHDIGRILQTLADLMGEKIAPNESVEHLTASNLAAAELLDRICFQEGFWDPRGAYSLMRAANAGKLANLHPLTVACVLRFLSEAIAHLPRTFVLKRMHRDDPELQQKAAAVRDYEPAAHEQKIPIDELQPGMRLSQPLHAFDGREILNGDLMLDQDLIWRLWQLSAIRPMNSPLVVQEENPLPES